jgi:hypothetical protein
MYMETRPHMPGTMACIYSTTTTEAHSKQVQWIMGGPFEDPAATLGGHL